MAWAKNEGRIYPIENAGRFWSVTTGLGIIDKSGALTTWAANSAARVFKEEVLKAGRRSAPPPGDCREVSLSSTISIDATWLDRIEEIAKKEFRRVAKEAADIGTDVHNMAEGYCRALLAGSDYVPPAGLDDRAYNAFELFVQWAKLVELEPAHIETKVWHTQHQYAGRLDLLARGFFDRIPGAPPSRKRWRKRRLYTIDTKTSKGFYDTFGPQISAYTEGYKFVDPHGLKVEGEGVLRVGKEDGVPEFQDYTEHHDINFRRFLAAHQAYILWRGLPK